MDVQELRAKESGELLTELAEPRVVLGRERVLQEEQVIRLECLAQVGHAYFAEQVGTFSIVVGVALLLAGVGFAILTLTAVVPVRQLLGKKEQAEQAQAMAAQLK